MKKLRDAVEGFESYLSRPVYFAARPILLLLVLPMAFAFTQPLWRMHFEAPQYPKGLDLYVHAYKLEGGNGGHDVQEINTLNHYIGMRHLDRAELSDLDWIPFALGLLVILALRVAFIGNVRSLVDLVVVTSYVGLFSLARFAYKLWIFGHDLDPKAPLHVDPFMPVVFGRKTIAQFTTESYPASGTYLIAVFATGCTVLLAWHLIAGRREHRRAAASRAAA